MCAARWSLMASGDSMAYASFRTLLWQPPCHGGMGSLFGGHCRQYNYRATEHSHQTFHARLLLCSVFCVVLIHALRCNDDD